MAENNVKLRIMNGAESYAMGLFLKVERAISQKVPPYICSSWYGAYVIEDKEGKPIGIVQLEKQPGQSMREAAAYLLDQTVQPANIPLCAVFQIPKWDSDNRVWNAKEKLTCSIREFVPVRSIVELDRRFEQYSTSSVHRIGIFDCRTLNHRCQCNLLVSEDGSDLIPIDHGGCLPEAFGRTRFAWLNWWQASVPFTQQELQYINNLNPTEDAELLQMNFGTLPVATLRMLTLCTKFLQHAAKNNFSLQQIGYMMTSELEFICYKLINEVRTSGEASGTEAVGFGHLTDVEWIAFLVAFPAAVAEGCLEFRCKEYKSM